MLILGIESSTNQVGCALGGPDGLLASAHTVRPRRHAESLTPQIEFIAEQAGVALDEVGAIAVDIGPGLFTGLRVGITTAISLAFALDLPMLVSSSLDLLAEAIARPGVEVVSLVDARRGEVFHASYEMVDGAMVATTEPGVSLPSDLVESMRSADRLRLLVGDGARAHYDLFDTVPNSRIASPSFDMPSASVLVSSVRARADRGEFVAVSAVAPLYLREPDAKANWTGVADRNGNNQ